MVYIYARVSTADQDTLNQTNELLKIYPGAHVVEETQSSRKIRPKLQELLEALEKGDTLIVWKFDRISRSMLELQKICQDINDRGVNLISTTENIDITTPMGKMFIAVLGMVAEMERENISERTKLGIKTKKALAEAKGLVYRKGTTHSKGGARPVPRSPKMIEMLMKLKEKGLTWERIAEKLAFANPDWKIGKSTVRRLFNREYAKRT